MNKKQRAALDAKCIARELREAFPGERFVVKTGLPGRFSLNVRYSNARLDARRVRRVVDRWYRAAYGTTMRWGRKQRT